MIGYCDLCHIRFGSAEKKVLHDGGVYHSYCAPRCVSDPAFRPLFLTRRLASLSIITLS